METNRVGICDSGVGGLSVWQAIKTISPNLPITYVCDQAYAPYGHQPKELIKQRGYFLLDWFLNHNIKSVVIACNTLTIQGDIQQMRRDFPDLTLVGAEPPTKQLIKQTQTNQVILACTSAVANSPVLLSTINDNPEIKFEIISPTIWVEYLEQNRTERELEEAVHLYLEPYLDSQVDCVGLGCTHYPLLLPILRRLYGHKFSFIDTSQAIANRTLSLLNYQDHDQSAGTDEFYTTGPTHALSSQLQSLLGQSYSVQSV